MLNSNVFINNLCSIVGYTVTDPCIKMKRYVW